MSINSFQIDLTPEQYDLHKVLHAGMAFRVRDIDDGQYLVQSRDKVAIVVQDEGAITIQCLTSVEDLEREKAFWCNYFNFEDTTLDMYSLFPDTPLCRDVVDYGAGLHLLRQDPWEATVAFILSQRNTIHNITMSVEKLCQYAGRQVYGLYKSFPPAKDLLDTDVLTHISAGFRVPYLRSAAWHVANGYLDFETIKYPNASYRDALRALLSVNGIGAKVANCICCFSLGHTDAFPIDVHIERILAHPDLKDFIPDKLGRNAALAQQYLYLYAITHNF